MTLRAFLFAMLLSTAAFSQVPKIEPGVSQELARWRAAHYSDVRYKLNLTLEKMSPVLKGTMEIRVNVRPGTQAPSPATPQGGVGVPIVLDWRKIKGHEDKSVLSNVSINGMPLPPVKPDGPDVQAPAYVEYNEHLVINANVRPGENVVKLDFTSPILPSGSAITRYVDKEDRAEYIYSLFVPSDASTAFPVFDQPDLKARFTLKVTVPTQWRVVTNGIGDSIPFPSLLTVDSVRVTFGFEETLPISSYVFALAAGPFEILGENYDPNSAESFREYRFGSKESCRVFVRRSQAEKLKPHAAEVFRLNREAVKYFEEYFDYKFPFPKYDLVLIPEFPFGGMEHAGATFLREASIIFPQEPTRNDHINRATLIFHEAAHQWFGDTVTMRWFDDLWLKEGFATFTAYKALEKIMPEMNAWKVFYERVKQGAYQTDSTRGTTPIYQEIPNLSAAKSAYGNIVYNKAPAFLRQAEFYLGEDKFRAAVRSFLKKHEFGNAGWEDLVNELETASKGDLREWANAWVKKRGVPIIKWQNDTLTQTDALKEGSLWSEKLQLYVLALDPARNKVISGDATTVLDSQTEPVRSPVRGDFQFPNYEDYGYGIFLLDEKSRDYVLKNIQNEKDPFLRSMMWGALWDSVREGELDPREYVELVVKVLMQKPDREGGLNGQVGSKALANARASANDLRIRVEDMLIAGMRGAETQGQRITYYRAFLNVAGSEKARGVLKGMLTAEAQRRGGNTGGNLSGSEGVSLPRVVSGQQGTLPTGRVSALAASRQDETCCIKSLEPGRFVAPGSFTRPPANAGGSAIPLKTKDKFDIVTRLLVLGDAEAPALLAELEKAETSDEAKRYAYSARAGIATAENKARYWKDFTENKEISESWIEAAFGPWNSIRHSELTLPYLERALKELPNHKRSRKIFFVNGWLGAFIGGQRSDEALAIVNKFLADNPNLDRDLRLKILENVDIIERAVKIRSRSKRN